MSPAGHGRAVRPVTAPAVSGAVDDVAHITLHECLTQDTQEVDGEEEDNSEDDTDVDEDLQDPAVLNAKASAAIYQLQHQWLQERQAEVGRLWEQLEQEYGFRLSEHDPVRQLEDFRSAADGADSAEAVFAALLPPVADDNVAGVDTEAQARVDDVLGLARNDLEVAQNFRQQLEQRRSSASACPVNIAPDAESARVDELRREVRLLQQRAQHAWEDTSALELPASDRELDEISGSEALTQWADNLRLLGAIGAGSDTNSSDLPSLRNATSASPLQVTDAGASARPAALGSRAAAAAEAQAVPVQEAIACTSSQMNTQDQPQVAGVGVDTNSSVTQAQIASCAAPAVPDCPSTGSGSQNSVVGMALQLDELLGELDEFDRIHDGLHKMTCC